MTRFDYMYEQIEQQLDSIAVGTTTDGEDALLHAVDGLLHYLRAIDEQLNDIREYNRLGDGS